MAIERKKEEQHLDLTPMIDVVFQLLIFFYGNGCVRHYSWFGYQASRS
jgi:biopolymer transport protein ExbD